jgi:hypothetical protein
LSELARLHAPEAIKELARLTTKARNEATPITGLGSGQGGLGALADQTSFQFGETPSHCWSTEGHAWSDWSILGEIAAFDAHSSM